jgi:MFS family permease
LNKTTTHTMTPTRHDRHAVMAAAFIFQLYMGIGVSLPKIMAGFDAMSYYAVAMVINSAGMTITAPIGGKLSDLFGRRKLLFGSLPLHIIGVLLAATAPNLTVFIAGYILISLACGLFMSLPTTLITDVTPIVERPKALGLSATVANIAMLAGPLLGGILTDNFNFRVTILYALPLSIPAVILLARHYHLHPHAKSDFPLDFPGIILLALGLTPLLVALSTGGASIAWQSMTMLLLISGGLLFVALFVGWEIRHPDPILSIHLFKIRSFTTANILTLLQMPYAVLSMSFTILLAQQGLGVSVTLSGSLGFPKTIAMILLPTIFGAWMAKNMALRLKPALIASGSLIVVAALVFLFGSLSPFALWAIYGAMLLIGISESFSAVSIMPYLQSELPPQNLGMGIAAQSFFLMLGISITTALFGQIYNLLGANIMASFPIMAGLAAISAVAFITLAQVSVRGFDPDRVKSIGA